MGKPDFLYYNAGQSPHIDSPTLRIFLPASGEISRKTFLHERRYSGLVDYDEFKQAEARRQILLPTFAKVVDFDGTLFDTESIQRAANALTFQKLGVEIEITPEIANSFRGKSDEAIFEMLLGSENHHLVTEGIRIRNDFLQKLAENETDLAKYLLPGIDEFVRLMRLTRQKVGIATASPDAYVYTFLKKVTVDGKPISDVFPPEAVIGSDTIREIFAGTDSEPKFKPDPYPVRLAASRVEDFPGLPIFYIGDSIVDGLTLRNYPKINGVLISLRVETRGDLENEFAGDENISVSGSLLSLVQ